MRLEPANRARLHSFPLKVTKHTLKLPLGFYLCVPLHKYIFIFFSLTSFYFQGQDSTCWKPQLTQLWSCPWTRPPCTTLRTHMKTHLQTHSELLSAPTSLWTLLRNLLRNMCKPEFVCFQGVHQSWVSCCRHKDITTGRPLCQEAQLTDLEWHTAQLIETACLGKTACHGVCSASLHHRGMHKAFSLIYCTSHHCFGLNHPSLLSVCPAAGISCSTMTFSPVCLWLRCLSEWVLFWITSLGVCLSTTPKVVSC